MADRRAVQAGGFWNSQSASFSAETQALLKGKAKKFSVPIFHFSKKKVIPRVQSIIRQV